MADAVATAPHGAATPPHRAATAPPHQAPTTASHDRPIAGPYPGLRAFQDNEGPIFFGRDEQIDGLTERLERERLVVIAGESGCGKSSLVHAGLLPALKAGFLHGGGTKWTVARLQPGNQPIINLADALVKALRPGQGNDAELLAARLRSGPRGICDLLNDCPLPCGTEMLILVDQFEELIRFRVRSDPDEADAFVALLLETVADKQAPVRAVLTLRSDYLGSCTIFPGLAEALNGSQYLVPRLGRDQLREAIINPARVFDGDVDSQLANQLINEIGQSQDQLPVLEHALLAMWSQPSNRRRTTDLGVSQRGASQPIHLKLDDFRALGGLGEALSRHADAVYHSLKDEEKKRIARRLFCALWDEGATGRDTRRPCPVREAAEIAGVTIDQLKEVVEVFRKAEHSFLTPADEPLTDTTMLDVSHESLFRHWSSLKDWIRVEAEGVERYRRLRSLAHDRRRKKADLLSGRTLLLDIDWWESQQPNAAWARKYSTTPAGRQTGEERPEDFALVERFLRDSQRAREKRRQLFWISLSTAVVVGYVVLGGKWRFSVETRTELLRQQVYSTLALSTPRSEPVHALQLALEAQGEGSNPQAEAALHSALRRAHFRSVVFPSLGLFQAARFLSPDSSRIITAGEADGLAVWNAAAGDRLYAFHGAIPAMLTVNSKATRVATASDDGTVDLWDLSTTQPPAKPLWTRRDHIARITELAFSPDDSLLATASEDGSAVLWSVQDGKIRYRLIDHLGAVTGLAFSHDGKRIATAGADGRIVLWDARSGHKLALFTQLPEVGKLAFDATGRFLAATSGNSLMLWDPVTGGLHGSLRHTSRVTALSFSPDGHRIATASRDGTLRVWDTSSLTERFSTSSDVSLHDDGRSGSEPLVSDGGEASRLRTVEFSADGRALVTTGADGSAKVWDVEAGGELLTFRAHEQAIPRIAVSPMDDQIATGSDDGTVTVWDAAGHRLFGVPVSGAALAMGYNATGTRLAVADGKRVVITSREGGPAGSFQAGDQIRDLHWYHGQDRIAIAAGQHVEIWDVPGDRPVATLDARTDVRTVSVSPGDDRYIASECRDPGVAGEAAPRICLWDAHRFVKLDALEHGGSVLSLRFGQNGTWLASSSDDRTIRIWQVGDHSGPPRTLGRYGEGIAGLAASPDGPLLISSADDRIRLWNTTSHGPLDGFPDAEYGSVAFFHNSKTFAAGGNDGVVRLYRIDNTSLQPLARTRTPFPLADRECEQYTNLDCRNRPTAPQLTNEIRYLLHRGFPLTWEQNILMAVRIDPQTFGAESTRFANAQKIRQAMEAISAALQAVTGSTSHAPRQPADGEQLVRLRSALERGQVRSKALLGQIQRDDKVVPPPDDLTERIARLVLARLARDHAENGNPTLAAEILELAPVPEHDGGWAEHAAADMANAAVMRSVRDHLARGEYKEAIDGLDPLRRSPEQRRDRALVLRRFIATTLDRAGDYPEAAKLARSLAAGEHNDVEVLADQAEILLHAGYAGRALAVLARGLKIDPTNDRALRLQGLAQSQLGQFDDAATTLRKVSPLSQFYKEAAATAGVLSSDKLARPTEGFRSMLLTVDPQDAGSWARLAQAAWATGRFPEALLMAGRVLEERAVKPSSPEVKLAIYFVRVAALCQSRDYDQAEAELRTMVAIAPSVTTGNWDYEGDQAAVKRIKDAHVQRFLQALLIYTRDRDNPGDSQRLFQLLHEARDAQTVPAH